MALQASGPISFRQIKDEFGLPPGRNLGAYRVSQTVSGLSILALDNEVNSSGIVIALIPQSGTIMFSNFYSKKLNVVINETPSSGTATRVNARSDYDLNNSKVNVIGGFKQRPSDPKGIKAWIHTNGVIGSNQKTNIRQYSSLLTGSWNATTDLRIDIGPSGAVFGAGGNGGAGGTCDNKDLTVGGNGMNGTSGIGINITNSVIINNRGYIQAGGGGGGGGGAAHAQHKFYILFKGNKYRYVCNGGSGGGGGSGFPAGDFGPFGIGRATGGSGSNTSQNGINGTSGTLFNGGNGGNSTKTGSVQSATVGGAGGGGSHNGLGGTGNTQNNDGRVATALDGENGNGGNGGNGSNGGASGSHRALRSNGGSGGLSGYSIVVDGSNGSVTIRDTGTIVGDITYNINPS